MTTRFLCLLAFMCISLAGFSQDYLDEIASEACQCVEDLPEGISAEEMQIQLGLCLLEASGPYEKKLKKDFNFNMADSESMEKFGETVGIRMAGICPSAIMMLYGAVSDDPEFGDDEEVLESSDEGIVTKIEDEQFVTFYIKGAGGSTQKYVWLTEVASDIDLSYQYESLLDRQVRVSFIELDIFDPRINEYRSIRVISEIFSAE
ncbi:hypothetical protein [Pontibacter sp. G13]|uniref:hypothetical protein n=1 Tax=Pontibacter sp. G13 TaxID=3074898 RepID=UPI002889A086|nr:hypothetical protein [Pontibacter sp. G13]WNJ20691.1 hypothetical protein RJD25_09435 [Pontibacter sp. G13]